MGSELLLAVVYSPAERNAADALLAELQKARPRISWPSALRTASCQGPELRGVVDIKVELSAYVAKLPLSTFKAADALAAVRAAAKQAGVQLGT